MPGEDVLGANGAGAVHIIYGSVNGLRASGNQLWHQESDGIDDTAESGDAFGSFLAAGDFDDDGRDDLAIAIPFETIDAIDGAGAVCVLYGSDSGLTGLASDFWHQDVTGIRDVAEEDDKFGSSLAAGDFDNDGRDDLAIGITGENVGTVSGAGAVQVVYGAPTGLVASGNQFWHQNSAEIRDSAEEFDAFGSSLATGDFDADGFDDLAVGADREDTGGDVDAGAVNVIHGSIDGLDSIGNQFWSQNSAGVADACEVNDRFGQSMTSGDFDGDGFADLAIGVEAESVGGVAFAGAVNVLYGSAAGLNAAGNQLWHQNKSGVLDSAEVGDRFGFHLTMGDFDGNNADDLMVGVPEETVGGVASAGAANVFYGTINGLTSDGDQFWHQDRPGILDAAEPNDSFGFASES